DYVDPAATGERVKVSWQRGHQRFAFARSHLSDLALMQNNAADHLHIEMAHAGGTHARLANDRESFGKNLVERLAFTALDFVFIGDAGNSLLQLFLKLGRARAQLV